MNSVGKLCAIALITYFAGCSSSEKVSVIRGDDGKYDTEFPDKNVSAELLRITNSIKLINSLAFYNKYVFDAGERVTKFKLRNRSLKEFNYEVESFNKAASGTATVISINDNKVLMLTCAHVVEFADTIFSYFSDENGKISPFLESISIKVNQTNYSNFPGGGDIEIIFTDKQNDVALIGSHFNSLMPSDFLTYHRFKIGDSSELDWGNFVYIFGFPLHNKMITRALVSKPEKSDDDSFLLDAVLNRGSSGSVVVAVRDGVPNFELVGMITRIPAEQQYLLKPEPLVNDLQYSINSIYKGNSMIGGIELIKYGLTRVIPINRIVKIIEQHSGSITANGFDMPYFIKQ